MKKLFAATFFLFSFTFSFAQNAESRLKISPLTGDFYIYTTYNLYKGTPYPANGMYLVTNKGVVIFDSPWDTTQFQPLLDTIWQRHHKKTVICIATHFHEDRTGGLEYYKQQGIKTYTTRKTDELSKKKGMKRAEFLIDKDIVFTVGQYSFQTYYPGEGHAPDNIVIWFHKEKILYGGCLIKSVADETLGNLSDANVKAYATTLQHVQQKCKDPKYIIPGHNDWTHTGSLQHTLYMAQAINPLVSPFIVDKNFKDTLSFTKKWDYPWYIVVGDDGKNMENTLGGTLTESDTAHLYHTANGWTNHQGKHHIRYCGAILTNDSIHLSFQPELPAYASELSVFIKGNTFTSEFSANYPAPTEKLSWIISKQKLILDKNSYVAGDTIKGYVEIEFIETDQKANSRKYYYKGYFKTLLVKRN